MVIQGNKFQHFLNGIVSRIEYKSYVWNPSANLLAIQIDAAINSGNSGGAVVNKDNKIVGIAMMKLSNAHNILYRSINCYYYFTDK